MPQWVPLEANPQVLSDYAHTLGMSRMLRFVDVWSVDLLEMVPAPRHAMLLLFPLTPALRAPDAFGRAAPAASAVDTVAAPLFIRQTIGNACGTIAILHALLQPAMLAAHPPAPNSALARLAADVAGKSAAECADILQKSPALDAAQREFAQRGQTAPPSAADHIDLHFVAFLHKDGALYQLDGRRDRPVSHGATTPQHMLRDACKVVKDKFMARDPNELRFTIIALVEGEDVV